MPQFEFDTALRTEISTRLAAFTPQPCAEAGLRSAAVTLILAKHPKTSQASAIVTLRPASMRRHGAQYALPGGRLDVGETEIEAAVRESSEELNLSLRETDFLGRLDDFPTRSGFRIAPFVAWCNETAGMRPDPTEVEEVIFIPLEELDSPDIPILETEGHSPQPVLSAFMPTLGHRIFAPTAAILYQFREITLRGQPTRVAHYGQPKFAWK